MRGREGAFRVGVPSYIKGAGMPPRFQMEPAPMAEIEIYTTPFCGYCSRAKRLLDKKGVTYREIDVFTDRALRDEMTRRAGGRTSVPQIFIDGKNIGGFDDMAELDMDGDLDPMLGIGG